MSLGAMQQAMGGYPQAGMPQQRGGGMPQGGMGMQRAKVPMIVKIFAVLLILGSLFYIFVGGLVALLGGFSDSTTSPSEPTIIGGVTVPAFLESFISILILLVGLVGLVAAIMLFKGKNWARYCVILISLFWIVLAGMSLIDGNGGIGTIVMNVVIIAYFLASKGVKASFH